MRELTTYINEKLDINKVNIKNKNFGKKFPIDGGMDEIKRYLLKNGFKEVNDRGNFDTYVGNLNSMATKVFSVGLRQLRFADTTYDTINEENPIFAININSSTDVIWSTEAKYWWEHKISKEKFHDRLKERFD